jgi:Amino acid permease
MADRKVSVSSATRRNKSVAETPVTSVLTGNEHVVFDRELTADEEVLAALGYKPEFKREFSLWTSFCVSFAVLGLLPSFASTLYYGMGYAGTAGMVWGWLIAMVFIQCVAMGMAELCSSMPTSGGLYYASAVLAPPGYGPFAAWVTGWSNWLAQVTGAPSVDYARKWNDASEEAKPILMAQFPQWCSQRLPSTTPATCPRTTRCGC